MENDELILSLLKESRDAVKELAKAVNKLERGIVGQVNCDAYRRDFNQRLTKVEEVCTAYQVTKPGLINETELRDARDEAIERAGVKYNQLETRVENIEKYIKLFGFVWGNPFVKATLIGSLLSVVGVYWGRVGQYGWHVVGAFLGAVAIVLIMSWISKRNNREVTKTKTKKLFGLKFLIAILGVVSACVAQGPPPIDGPAIEQHPVVFGMERTQQVVDAWGEMLTSMGTQYGFLNANDTLPASIFRNNSSYNITA
jgi:hypothetical protein